MQAAASEFSAAADAVKCRTTAKNRMRQTDRTAARHRRKTDQAVCRMHKTNLDILKALAYTLFKVLGHLIHRGAGAKPAEIKNARFFDPIT